MQKSRREDSAAELKEAVEKIHSYGCVMKDLDIGLLDFPDTLQRRRSLFVLEARRERHPLLARR